MYIHTCTLAYHRCTLYVHICMNVCLCVYECMYVLIHCIYIHTHTCIDTLHKYRYTHICLFVCVCVCVYLCAFDCVLLKVEWPPPRSRLRWAPPPLAWHVPLSPTPRASPASRLTPDCSRGSRQLNPWPSPMAAKSAACW